ncbi:MAG TPA: NTP transferase domain-containing protein [Candidatus Limnocylindria bacterium]|nr:NTP transferase domain-containing protein [Candidatus Limnocylindria bacterium]
MLPAERVAGLILAAGAATRFGSPKIVARLGDRPMLAHVIDTAKAAGLGPVVVVLGEGAVPAGAGLDLASVRVVRNPRPEDGLSSSLRIGLAALRGTEPEVQAALVLLADQPLVRTDVIAALLAGEVPPGRTIVVPRYADGGGPNPALLLRAAWPLADEVTGDRGMGPLIAARPELVAEVPVEGGNPDVDTPADLALVEWAHRVRANRAQVDRVREVADGDFYAATSSLFVVDPRRSDADDPALAELRRLARPGETWLDIGAGAGRYALPLALIVREVIAVDPSPTMLAGLRAGMAEHGIDNVRVIDGRWPLPAADLPESQDLSADVALIAHVAYDIEAIGPFLDAMEAAAGRLCVAVMTDRTPAALAEAYWPIVHGEARIPLPAMPAFVDLLHARGREPDVRTVDRMERFFGSRDEALASLRRQTWVAPDGPKDRRLQAALDAHVSVGPDGSIGLIDAPILRLSVATWLPRS